MIKQEKTKKKNRSPDNGNVATLVAEAVQDVLADRSRLRDWLTQQQDRRRGAFDERVRVNHARSLVLRLGDQHELTMVQRDLTDQRRRRLERARGAAEPVLALSDGHHMGGHFTQDPSQSGEVDLERCQIATVHPDTVGTHLQGDVQLLQVVYLHKYIKP